MPTAILAPSPRRTGQRPVIPYESALLLGLLYDLLCAPAWLVLLLLGRARLDTAARPLRRVAAFIVSSRLTATLILLNLVVFTLEVASQAQGLSERAFLRRFTLVPSDLASGNYLPVLTHVFSHASPMHLLGNMLTLFVFGRVVERHLAPVRMLLCYLGAALISTALSIGAQLAAHQNVPTLGASGAIAGMVALGILFEPFTLSFEALLPLPLMVLGWLAITADLSGVLRGGPPDGIDHFAHLGGYLSVCLIYAFLPMAKRRRVRLGLVVNVLTVLLGGMVYVLAFRP